MNHELLKTVIQDQHGVIERSEIVPREYKFEKNANYILVGLRRAGKSTMLYKLVKDLLADGVTWNQIIYINFEDERLSEFSIKDFDDILSVQSEISDDRGYYFFDEIQNIDGWERFARRMADSKERVYITGSNAKMLSKDMEAKLGGRYMTKLVYPYNFREYLEADHIKYDKREGLSTRTKGKIAKALNEYMHFGGFPESVSYSEKREYVENIYQKILLGDIITRNDIRNPYALRILIKKIAETICNDVSFTKLHSSLLAVGTSVSKDAIISYVSYARDAYLIFSIKNYVSKFAERESNPKYYFCDNGLLGLFLYNKGPALLENVVAVSLHKKYEENLYYLKSTKTKTDIDFYIPEDSMAVQVSYSIEGEAREREIMNLVRLSKQMDAITKYIIITYEEEDTIKTDGITIDVIPLLKFLADE